MSWMDEMIDAPTSGGGNYFKDGKGRVIVKDVKVFKGHKDKYTYCAEFVVKTSSSNYVDPETGKPVPPNPAGSSVSYTQLLTKFDSAKGNAKKCNLAILGPEAEKLAAAAAQGNEEAKKALAKELNELMRIDADGPMKGYTKPGVLCPARGMELAFETRRQWTKDNSKELTIPEFTHVPFNAENVKANRAFLDNVAEAEKAAAADATNVE
jgi:hypothetical protein